MKTDTFDNIDKSTVTEDKTKEAMENGGLPKGIHTEAQLWDEILKKEVLEMPFLLLPVIAEAHGKSYPADTKITPVGTEYSVERIVTKDISSIRSDATIRIESQLFHFECESDTGTKIVKRVFEYDSQASLTYAEKGTKTSPWQLNFPYSTVLFLEPHTRISDHLSCELRLPVYSADTRNTEMKSIDYAVPTIKVQNYTLQEIREKQLFLLIPFTPIRFRKLTVKSIRKDQNYNSDFAKLELTNFFHEIIILLDEATLAGTICEIDRKDILALLRKAMIRVFHEDPFLSEVVNHMTAPVLELERETIARLQRENEALRSERGAEKSKMDAEKSKMDAEKSKMDAEKSKMDAEKSRMNAEMDALRSERDALKSQNMALITEVESLRAPKGPFRSWRKRLKRNH